MSTNPPPLFSRIESIKVFATPKALRWMGVLLVLLIAPSSAERVLHPEPSKAGPIPLPTSTTEAQGWSVPALFGTLPPADPRQKNAVCRKALGQYMLKGACWQRIPVEPPCPVADGAFEHDEDHKCYVPVLRAERPKQSGDPQLVNVAGEEE